MHHFKLYCKMINIRVRGHPGLNRGPLDLQSNALPLSYIPTHSRGNLPPMSIKNSHRGSGPGCFQNKCQNSVYNSARTRDLQRGYSSVVEHSTADREVPGSNPGVP